MDNKNIILKKSINLFANKGYDAVGVQLIADESKITKPTLYHYFGSKNGLLSEILNKYFDILFKEVEKIDEAEPGPNRRIKNLISIFFTFAWSNEDFYKLMLSLYVTPKENEIKNITEPYFTRLFELLEKHITITAKEKKIKEDLVYLRIQLWSTINGFINLFFEGKIELNEKIEEKVFDYYMKGVK